MRPPGLVGAVGLGLIFGAVAVFLLVRPERGAPAEESDTSPISTSDEILQMIGDTVQQAISGVRGIRNNNPGNIRKSSEKWQGLDDDQTDPAFFRFRSMAYGVRAMAKILRNYSIKYNLDTVGEIINRWAPPAENNTSAYSRAVAAALNVSTTAPIDVDDAETLFTLVRAIIAHENGSVPALLISDAVIRQGIELA